MLLLEVSVIEFSSPVSSSHSPSRTQINFTVAIDFTASNGEWSSLQSFRVCVRRVRTDRRALWSWHVQFQNRSAQIHKQACGRADGQTQGRVPYPAGCSSCPQCSVNKDYNRLSHWSEMKGVKSSTWQSLWNLITVFVSLITVTQSVLWDVSTQSWITDIKSVKTRWYAVLIALTKTQRLKKKFVCFRIPANSSVLLGFQNVSLRRVRSTHFYMKKES